MRLITEDLPAIGDVTPADLEQIFADDVFGEFAILEAPEGSFIQAGCLWEASSESAKFLQETGSDPWRLEYKDGPSGKHFAAKGELTIAQVTRAFVEYLTGDDSWRSRFNWVAVEY